MIKCIIFDLDGTLLNTLDDIYYAANNMLQTMNYPNKSSNDIKLALGYGVRELIKRLCPADVSEQELKKALTIYQDYYDSHQDIYTKPYDGILELLYALKIKNYKLAIVSNKIDYLVKELNKKLFNGLIDEAVGEITNIPIKPDPTSIINTLALLGCQNSEAIYIGDTEVDILTALNSKLTFIGCSWGFRSKDMLIAANAQIIIDTPLELLSILEKLYE